ncbi:ig-like domain-containing protein [Caerostris extrusa]|uniref:Ig-like domain-containing protein n=1 Tax=Caerostris extrusa TaxID=172846 RepID=A0AAV4X215_CAEEX|nr:ig-like domain-containing protein [Caerostris extrusa]
MWKLIQVIKRITSCKSLQDLISADYINHDVRPLDVRIISPPHHLSAGRKVTLECESTGSRPRAVMTWWKGSQKIQTGNEVISDNGNLTLSTLSFVPTADDHGKKFTCTAKNPSLSNSLIEDTRTITVHCK